jgi:hypothetical protein
MIPHRHLVRHCRLNRHLLRDRIRIIIMPLRLHLCHRNRVISLLRLHLSNIMHLRTLSLARRQRSSRFLQAIRPHLIKVIVCRFHHHHHLNTSHIRHPNASRVSLLLSRPHLHLICMEGMRILLRHKHLNINHLRLRQRFYHLRHLGLFNRRCSRLKVIMVVVCHLRVGEVIRMRVLRCWDRRLLMYLVRRRDRHRR